MFAGNFVAIGFKGSPTIEIWDLDVVCKCSCLLDLYICYINHEIVFCNAFQAKEVLPCVQLGAGQV